MKSLTTLSAALVLSLGVMACDQEEETVPAPAPSTTQQPAGGESAMDSASRTVTGATDAAREEATAAADAATAEADQAKAKLTQEAQTKLDEVMTYIKENKYDLAEKTLAQLEAQKASLPESIQTQLPKARQALNAAKASGGAEAPKLPGATQ